MSGIHPSTGVPGARLGLEAAVRAALAGDDLVDVYAGFQWPTTQPDWVALGDARGTRDPKTVASRRQVDETITLELNIGSWRPGHGGDVAAEAWARTFDLLARIETYILDGDHITLGGEVLWCLPGDIDTAGAEYESGYQVEVAATFICSHRVRAV